MAYPAAVQYNWRVHTISAPTFLMLGADDPQSAHSWLVELRPAGATFTMTPRGRVQGIADPVNTDAPLAYDDNTASPGTLTNAPFSATASSTKVILRIPGDGLTVALDFSAFSAGSVDVIVTGVRGS